MNGTPTFAPAAPATPPAAQPSHLEEVVRTLDAANVPRVGLDGTTELTVAQRVAILAAWARARRGRR